MSPIYILVVMSNHQKVYKRKKIHFEKEFFYGSMEEKIIQSLGLTKNETRIYLTLLRIGSSTAGEITERCGVHRRNVYDSIERLMGKGLVSSVIINNRKYFRSEEPERFLSLIEERKSKLDEQKKILMQIIPKIKPIANTNKQEVRFYKGKEGLKTVYEDILKIGKNYIGYGPGEEIENLLKGYMHYYSSKRIKLKIRAKLIYNDSSRSKRFVNNPLLDIKYLKDQYSSHAALRIYSNKVAILLFSEEEPIAIVIENKSISEGYRKYFQVLWDAAEK